MTPLTNGVTYTGDSYIGLFGAGGTQTYYSISVPAGQAKLTVETSGGDGDLGLYVRRGALPTLALYDAASTGAGTTQSVTIANPAADTYYILLQGVGSGYLGASVKATVGIPPTWTWAKSTEGGDYQNTREAYGIAHDSSGNLYLTGYCGGTINFGANRLTTPLTGFLAKYTPSGTSPWAITNVGTKGWAVSVGPDDNVYVAGEFSGTVSFSSTTKLSGSAGANAFVAKYSPSGALLWAKALPGAGATSAYSVSVNAATGHLVVGGYETQALTRQPSGGRVVKLWRLTADGAIMGTFTASGADASYATSVTLDDTDSVYLGGTFKETLALPGKPALASKTDANGVPNLGGFVAELHADNTVDWTSSISGGNGVDVTLNALAADGSGGVWTTGTAVQSGQYAYGYLMHFNSTDHSSGYLLAQSLVDDYASTLAPDGSGGVYWGGVFQGTLSLGTVFLSNTQGAALYVVNVDATGNPRWGIATAGDNPNTMLDAITAGGGGDIEVVGIYGGSCAFGATTLSTSGYHEIAIARFDVPVAPKIVTQPTAQTAAVGQKATFSIVATGTNLTYQWQKNGVNISGATNSVLVLDKVQASDAGNYTVVVTSGAGQVVSNAGTLTVPASVSRLTSVSVRANAGTGDQALIVGLWIGGGDRKSVLIRGIGPGLTPFGITGALSDPSLTLFNANGVQMQQNDNWGGGADLAAAFASVYAFALPSDSKDAAMLVPLSAGGYTAQISGAGNSTGVALVEAYDADLGSPAARFVSISARDQVGTGDQILVAGFVITGNAPKTLLIRGVGPGLSQFGVNGVLADPQIKLFDSHSAEIQENNDWGGGAALSQAFAKVGAFALPANSKDAALLVTLQPGLYTAQVSGVGGTTGVALVEVYEVP